MTNENQSFLGFCPEDHTDVKGIECEPSCKISSSSSITQPTSISSTYKTDTATKTQESRIEKLDQDTNRENNKYDSTFTNRSQVLSSQEKDLKKLKAEETTLAYIEDLNIVKPFSERHQHFFNNPRRKKRSTEKVRDSSKNNKIGETIYDYDKSVFYDTRDLPIVRHPYGSGHVRCVPLNSSNCEPERIVFKAHGPQTGMCVNSDR